MHHAALSLGRTPPAAAFAFVIVATLLPGCLGDDGNGPAHQPTTKDKGNDVGQGADTGSSVETGEGTDAAAPTADGDPSRPPRYSVGDWWTWRVQTASNEPEDVTLAVADHAEGSYYIGATDKDALMRTYPAHATPAGVLNATHLGWHAHGSTIPLFRFPLVVGDSWSASGWLGEDLTVTLADAAGLGEANDERAMESTVTYATGEVAMRAWYSIDRERLSRVEILFGADTPFTQAELVAAGSGETGPLHTPIVRDLVRARWGGAPGPTTLTTLAPLTFDAPAHGGALFVACWMGGGPGTYQVLMQSTSGAFMACRHANGPDESTFVMQPFAADATTDTWAVSGSVAALGTASLEVFDVTWWERE